MFSALSKHLWETVPSPQKETSSKTTSLKGYGLWVVSGGDHFLQLNLHFSCFLFCWRGCLLVKKKIFNRRVKYHGNPRQIFLKAWSSGKRNSNDGNINGDSNNMADYWMKWINLNKCCELSPKKKKWRPTAFAVPVLHNTGPGHAVPTSKTTLSTWSSKYIFASGR